MPAAPTCARRPTTPAVRCQPDAVVLRGGRVFLLPDLSVDCDAVRFERAADDALTSGDAVACRAAAGLYGAELLPEAATNPGPKRRACACATSTCGCFGKPASWSGWFMKIPPTKQPTCSSCVRSLLRDADPRPCGGGVTFVTICSRPWDCGRSAGGGAVPRMRCGNGGRRTALRRASAGAGACAGAPARRRAGAWRRRARAGWNGQDRVLPPCAEEARGLGWQVRSMQASDWTRPYGLTADLVEPC